MKPVALLVLVALLSAPTAASDFSALGKPEFARSLLLPAARQRDLSCVGLAIANARLKRGVSQREATAKGEALRPLLAIELGSDDEARQLIERNESGWGPHFYDKKAEAAQRFEVMKAMSAQCASLDAAFRSGGIDGFRAALAPSAGLIALLPLPECIALAERSASDGSGQSMFDARDLAEMRTSIANGRSAADRANLDAAVSVARTSIASAPMNAVQLRLRAVSCLAVFRQEIEPVPAIPAGE